LIKFQTGIARIAFDLTLLLSCWLAAKKIHEWLVLNVLRLPLEFFDVTPIGRLLSRFGMDVDVLDSRLPELLLDFVVCAVEVNLIRCYWVTSTSVKRFSFIVSYQWHNH